MNYELGGDQWHSGRGFCELDHSLACTRRSSVGSAAHVASGRRNTACGHDWLERVTNHRRLRVRYAGTILQVLELLTVADGLRRTRRQFRLPALRARVNDWFRRLVAAFRQPTPISGKAFVSSGGAHMTGEARVRLSVGPGASVDQRLDVLAENVNRLEQELDAKIGELRRKIGEVEESLSRESRERSAGDESTARKIEELAVGGLHLEVVGLLWLMLGVLGTSIPGETAALLSSIGW